MDGDDHSRLAVACSSVLPRWRRQRPGSVDREHRSRMHRPDACAGPPSIRRPLRATRAMPLGHLRTGSAFRRAPAEFQHAARSIRFPAVFRTAFAAGAENHGEFMLSPLRAARAGSNRGSSEDWSSSSHRCIDNEELVGSPTFCSWADTNYVHMRFSGTAISLQRPQRLAAAARVDRLGHLTRTLRLLLPS